jgi:hypothetical protein
MNAERTKKDWKGLDLMNPADVAVYLGVTRKVVYTLHDSGKMVGLVLNPGSKKERRVFTFAAVSAYRKRRDAEDREQRSKEVQAKRELREKTKVAEPAYLGEARFNAGMESRQRRGFDAAVTALLTVNLEHQAEDQQLSMTAGLVELHLMTDGEFAAIRTSSDMTLAQLALDYCDYHTGSEGRGNRGPEWPLHDALPEVKPDAGSSL